MTTPMLASSSSSSLNVPPLDVNSQDILSDQDELILSDQDELPKLTDPSTWAPPASMPPLPSIYGMPTRTISRHSLTTLCRTSQTVMVYGK